MEENTQDIVVEVRLRDRLTGRVGMVLAPAQVDADGALVADEWATGSKSCDCQRAVYLYGQELPHNALCDDKRYTVDGIVNRATGDLLYAEG